MAGKPEFTMEQVAQHNSDGDYWIVIDGKVYDVSKFMKVHPGGAGILRQFGGKDCTEEFFDLHKAEVLSSTGAKLVKGTVSGTEVGVNEGRADYHKLDVAPYSEPAAYMGWHSPYYKESHKTFRLKLRSFVEDVLKPEAFESEELGDYPSEEIYQEMGKCGLLASRIGKAVMPVIPMIPGIELEKSLGVKPKEFDHFHELIAHEEMGRLQCPSYSDGLGAGFCIGLPPVAYFCPPHIRDKVVPEVLMGHKRICLAISEPAAGSDVAGMTTTAVKTPDGKHYIVNGVKKWITNGMFADYFSTAVRTGAGRGGISMLFISRDMGVETKAIKTTYSSCAGTALVIFDNVKVPVENLMGLGNKGKEGQGFACIMFNFNHERWFIVAQFLAAARLVLADCFKWASTRKAFGKPLMEQAVLRNKLARMAGSLESVHALLENVTYQMDLMPYEEQQKKLGGPIALLKFQATRCGTTIADEAVQMFGGRGITRTGMGLNIERFQKTYKYASILGGSEEVLADLAIRQQLVGPAVKARL
jgi:alkylation response protein AidB-like acyl-CoA dehydrogenase/predicted heme/steroid binding protein